MGSRSSAFLQVLTGESILLAAWFAYISGPVKLAIGMQIVAFLALLFNDQRLRTGEVISATYFRLRTLATLIAVMSLLAVIAQ